MNEQDLLNQMPESVEKETIGKPVDAPRYLFAPLFDVLHDGMFQGKLPAGMVVPVVTQEKSYNVQDIPGIESPNAANLLQRQVKIKTIAPGNRQALVPVYPGDVVNDILRAEREKGVIEVTALDGITPRDFVQHGLFRLFKFKTDEFLITHPVKQYEQQIAALVDYDGFGAQEVKAAITQVLAAIELAKDWCWGYLNRRTVEIEMAKGGDKRYTGSFDQRDFAVMSFLGIRKEQVVGVSAGANVNAQPQDIGKQIVGALAELNLLSKPAVEAAAPVTPESPTEELEPPPNPDIQEKLAALRAEVEAQKTKVKQEAGRKAQTRLKDLAARTGATVSQGSPVTE